MGDFVPILRRPGPAVKCQRRLDRLFSNFCRTHEWNLGERVDVAQQLNALKFIFDAARIEQADPALHASAERASQTRAAAFAEVGI